MRSTRKIKSHFISHLFQIFCSKFNIETPIKIKFYRRCFDMSDNGYNSKIHKKTFVLFYLNVKVTIQAWT